jgi:hypothetical protein
LRKMTRKQMVLVIFFILWHFNEKNKN